MLTNKPVILSDSEVFNKEIIKYYYNLLFIVYESC